jgi:hypothetical protein
VKNGFFPRPTSSEITFLGQLSNLGVESGLDRVFEAIDHVGFDRINFTAVEV